MALGAIAAVVAGLLSAGAAVWSQRRQEQMAQQQQDFQERMSSTAAQRSVEDYRRAGLNPALAYDRSASSPGGASAILGDPINTALNSARQTAALMQEMKIAKQDADTRLQLGRAEVGLKKGQERQANAAADLSNSQTALNLMQNVFAHQQQPYTLRSRAAEALLAELSIPGARNEAGWQNLIGRAGPGLNTALTTAKILELLGGRR